MLTQSINISLLYPNSGQIPDLPKNPRFIKDDRFKALIKSLRDDPEMLDLRELIVFPLKNKTFVVIAGNMRLQAGKEIGLTEMPCKILDKNTAVEKLKAYTIKDNVGYGSDDFDLLANEWDAVELEHWGMEIPELNNKEHEDLSHSITAKFKIEITCTDETHQEKIYNELIKKGYLCRILTL